MFSALRSHLTRAISVHAEYEQIETHNRRHCEKHTTTGPRHKPHKHPEILSSWRLDEFRHRIQMDTDWRWASWVWTLAAAELWWLHHPRHRNRREKNDSRRTQKSQHRTHWHFNYQWSSHRPEISERLVWTWRKAVNQSPEIERECAATRDDETTTRRQSCMVVSLLVVHLSLPARLFLFPL